MKKALIFLIGFLLMFFGLRLSNNLNSPKDYSKNAPNLNNSDSFLITKVIDGDTAILENGKHVRFLGENSPEHDEGFFNEAKVLNEKLILKKVVRLEFEKEKIDRYGRILAYVFIGDNLINAEIVKNGFSIADFMQKNEKYQSEILTAENYAKSNCLGFWAGECSEIACLKITNINLQNKNWNSDKNSQWIEITNFCKKDLNLRNWSIKDTSSSNRYRFKNFNLNSNAGVVIYSGCGNDNLTQLFWSCPSPQFPIWNRDGDHAFLLNSDGFVISDFKYP